jgi:hypothetical protein
MHSCPRWFASLFLMGCLAAATQASASFSADRPIHVTHPLRYGTITIDARLPLALDPLPFFELRPIAPPTRFVSTLLEKLPFFPLVRHDHLLISTNGEVVRAVVDPQSGDASFVPDLNRPHSGAPTLSASGVATRTLSDEGLIPHDATRYRLSREILVWGSAAKRNQQGALELLHPAAPEFTFVAAQRFAAGHPVYGKGSRMLLSISPQGRVVGLLRRWKSAIRSAHPTPITPRPQQIVAEIRRQLKPYAATNSVHVDSIEEAYYDNNQRYLQPVLRYTAVITPRDGTVPPGHIYGFLPLCGLLEPIPTLKAHQAGDEPALPPQRHLHSTNNAPLFVREASADVNDLGTANQAISLGEYAMEDANMRDMARDFRDGISGALGGEHIGAPIERTDGSLNSVNIAYSQSYGNTGNRGLGAAAGGRLATWIIDASNAVPSYDDRAGHGGLNAFEPWFPVFHGLHNVVGFRTQIWLHDGLNVPFSQDAALGLDINAAWFQEIAADSNYNGDAAYDEPMLRHYVHFGRASVFVDSRNCGHSIYDVAPQTEASILWNFWMGD